jgi:hypothetical protein
VPISGTSLAATPERGIQKLEGAPPLAFGLAVIRIVENPRDFEQPQRDSNPCRHLERVVS